MEKNGSMHNDLIDAMFKAGAHFGYQKSRRHPSVKQFIFGAKNRTEIIDLEQVQTLLGKAEEFVSSLGSAGKQIVFVGNKPEARLIVERAAAEAGVPFARERWIGGTITNWPEIKKRIARMEDLAGRKERGELSIYTKKEQLLLAREVEKLRRFFGGLSTLKNLPAALFVIDPKKESTAVSEARKLRIPVVALAGSDCDISLVDYPIVANDTSVSSIAFFVERMRDAYLEGKKNPTAPEVKPENKQETLANA